MPINKTQRNWGKTLSPVRKITDIQQHSISNKNLCLAPVALSIILAIQEEEIRRIMV
jgi:hypothetical protein